MVISSKKNNLRHQSRHQSKGTKDSFHKKEKVVSGSFSSKKSMAGNDALRLINISFNVKERAILKNINLSIKRGEFVTVLGSNGAGKSTILKILLGFYQASQGEIFIMNQRLQSKNLLNLRKEMAYMPQSFDVDKHFPILVKDVLEIGCFRTEGLLRRFASEEKEKINSVVKEFKIGYLLNKPFGVISDGEKQKVMLARILTQNPKILLLDEPNLNLDLYAYKNFLRQVENIYKRYKLTILFITHLITHIPSSTSRIIVIKNGQITFNGSKKAIFNRKDYLSFIYG